MEVSEQLHTPATSPPGIHWIGWVGPRVSMNDMEKTKNIVPLQRNQTQIP
jgi:hypothetical protein